VAHKNNHLSQEAKILFADCGLLLAAIDRLMPPWLILSVVRAGRRELPLLQLARLHFLNSS
jgi:hypothetical protein